jgi:hypothetical protein
MEVKAMGVGPTYSDLAGELERRRAILREYARRVERLPPENPAIHGSFADELKKMTADITAEIDRIQSESPSGWQAERDQLDSRLSELKRKMNGALSKLPSETFLG